MYMIRTFHRDGTSKTWAPSDDLDFRKRDEARQFALLLNERAHVTHAVVFERRSRGKWGTCFDTRHGY